MKHLNTQKGFTLVELAIVMTIIGLLIGGILKGQELMANARVTSTIAQVRAYEAATTTFRDKYESIPGDMTTASTRIPNCNGAGCNAAVTSGTNGRGGDGIIGSPVWVGAAGVQSMDGQAQGSTALATAVNDIGFETNLFWTHLLLSDLISGVTNASVSSGSLAWGESHPAAKIGGGFVVGYGNGTTLPGATAAATGGPSGMILALVSAPQHGNATALTVAGQQPLTPTRSAQIDRKMDDGRSQSGYVQSYGVAANCVTAAAGGYLENVTSNDCGLVFRIQG